MGERAYNGDLAAKVRLDVAILDGIRTVVAYDLEQTFDTHLRDCRRMK
jgi:hypothetical protein